MTTESKSQMRGERPRESEGELEKSREIQKTVPQVREDRIEEAEKLNIPGPNEIIEGAAQSRGSEVDEKSNAGLAGLRVSPETQRERIMRMARRGSLGPADVRDTESLLSSLDQEPEK